jgi:hypothetical protein
MLARVSALIAFLMCCPALAGHLEPVGCPQKPAETGTVTSPTGSCVNTIAAACHGQAGPAAPTKPASTAAFQMQGLSSGATIFTPTRTGTVLMLISGNFVSTVGTVGVGAKIELSYGCGSNGPANAAALTGTQIGPILEYTNPAAVTAADVFIPFSIHAVVTGLTINTACWIDLAAEAVTTASEVGVSNIDISALEQ